MTEQHKKNGMLIFVYELQAPQYCPDLMSSITRKQPEGGNVV